MASDMNLEATEQSLIEYAVLQDIDLDSLLESASKHFQSDTLPVEPAEITEEDIREIAREEASIRMPF